ncbi:MAG: YihY/virulence factor BrkB family protein [bacterium]
MTFSGRVVRKFLANKGLLLAGAVGYNTLLSLVPLLAVTLYIISRFMDPAPMLGVVAAEIDLAIPGQTVEFTQAVTSFLEAADVIGPIGIVVLLFFSSLAFRMIEDAMAIIFRHHTRKKSRHPLIAALIPFAYVSFISVGIFALTVLTTTVEAASATFAASQVATDGFVAWLLRGANFLGFVALFASFYRVLPMARVRLRLALVGGLVAAVLWELVRAILVYYFAHISIVGVVYGSLATVVIVLLSLEIAAVIVLLGAQVIAEIEVSAEAGIPWYEEPKRVVHVIQHNAAEDQAA